MSPGVRVLRLHVSPLSPTLSPQKGRGSRISSRRRRLLLRGRDRSGLRHRAARLWPGAQGLRDQLLLLDLVQLETARRGAGALVSAHVLHDLVRKELLKL